MRRGAIRTLVATVIVLGAGCGLLTDLSDLGGDAALDSDSNCVAPTLACVPPAPSGWIGPFWIYDGNPAQRPKACPSSAPTLTVQGHAGLEDASVACATTCGFGASSCSVNVTAFQDPDCSVPAMQTQLQGGCFHASGQVKKGFEIVSAVTTSCNVEAEGSVLSQTWSTDMLGCTAPATDASCTSGLCMATAPLPFEAKPCVFQSGDVSCPGAPYSAARPLLYAGVTVSCAQPDFGCGCHLDASADCGVAVDYVGTDPSCAARDADFGATQCIAPNQYIDIVTTPPSSIECSVFTLPEASCGAPKATPSAGGPFTVCCMP